MQYRIRRGRCAGRCFTSHGAARARAAAAGAGELHGPYTYLAVYLAGKSRMVYVPKALSELAAEHVAGTQASEALLAEISQINLELLRRRALE